jgi:hypothetical protein
MKCEPAGRRLFVGEFGLVGVPNEVVFDCSVPPIVTIGFAIVGAAMLALSVLAWRNPQGRLIQRLLVNRWPTEAEADPVSRFFGWTREKAGPNQIWSARLMAPIVGSVFFLAGVYTTWGLIAYCPSYQYIMPDVFGPIALRSVAVSVVICSGLFTALIAYVSMFRVTGVVYRASVALLMFAFTFCWARSGVVSCRT